MPLLWLLKFALKFVKLLKGLLSNLSQYPGMGFLRPAAEGLSNFLSTYYSYIEKSERIKQSIALSKEKSKEFGQAVTPGGKKGPSNSASQGASGPTPGGGGPVVGGGGPVPGGSGPTGTSGSPGTARPSSGGEAKGTLMIDAFMQGTEAPPDLKQRWLDAAAAKEQPPSSGGAKPAYYGTLMAPDQQRASDPEPMNLAGPPQRAPLFSDPVPADSAARWIPPARSEVPSGSSPMQFPAQVVEHWPAAQESPPNYVEPYRQAARTEATSYATSNTIDEEPIREWSQAQSSAAMLDDDQPAMIPLAEREQQLARLGYVCQFLREARQPLCPLNGAMALLPLSTIEAGPREVVELQKAVKADLAAIQHELKLRFPVTALAVGLEEDRGFEELIRRVGPERTKSQRFGHRFDVRAVATPAQLTALSARISGVFEDWVYAIYRERGSIARQGNSHLFGLLCKVRTQLQERLVRILCGGFGHDPEQSTRGEPVAFSGCYFAATGRTDDCRAFVEGVFDKLSEEQDNVEWTRAALREDRRFRRIGWLGLLVLAGSGVALLVGHLLR